MNKYIFNFTGGINKEDTIFIDRILKEILEL